MWKPVCDYISGALAFCVYSINSTTLGVCVTEFDRTQSHPHFPVFQIARLQIWLVRSSLQHTCRNVSYDAAGLRQVALNTRATSCVWRLCVRACEHAAQQTQQSHTLSGFSPHGQDWTIMCGSNSHSHLEWEYVTYVTYLSLTNTWINDYRWITTGRLC